MAAASTRARATIVKRWVKFGMASAENNEPDISNPIIRADYAALVSRFRAMVSFAIAAGVAMTLRYRYGVDHLSKGAVGIVDDESDANTPRT